MDSDRKSITGVKDPEWKTEIAELPQCNIYTAAENDMQFYTKKFKAFLDQTINRLQEELTKVNGGLDSVLLSDPGIFKRILLWWKHCVGK